MSSGPGPRAAINAPNISLRTRVATRIESESGAATLYCALGFPVGTTALLIVLAHFGDRLEQVVRDSPDDLLPCAKPACRQLVDQQAWFLPWSHCRPAL